MSPDEFSELIRLKLGIASEQRYEYEAPKKPSSHNVFNEFSKVKILESISNVKIEPKTSVLKDSKIISNTQKPLSQIYQCIFNPDIIENHEANLDKKSKLKMLLNLSAYSYIILICILFTIEFINSFISNKPISLTTFSDFVSYLLVCSILALPMGVAAAFITVTSFRIGGYTVGGISLGIILGTIISIVNWMTLDPKVGFIGAMALGIDFGIDFGIAFGIAFGFIRDVSLGIYIGIIFGIAGGIAGIFSGNIGLGITFGIALSLTLKRLVDTNFNIDMFFIFTLIGGAATSLALGTAGGIAEIVSFIVAYLGLTQLTVKTKYNR